MPDTFYSISRKLLIVGLVLFFNAQHFCANSEVNYLFEANEHLFYYAPFTPTLVDSDGDGIDDANDLDDDNDGITDKVESPNCFFFNSEFESGDRRQLINVTSDWTWNDGNLSRILNGDTTDLGVRITGSDFIFNDQVFLNFQFNAPVEINSYTIYSEGEIFLDEDLVGVFQGSNDNSNWTDLTVPGNIVLPDTIGPSTINVSQNAAEYSFYRIFVNTGRIDGGEWLREIVFDLAGAAMQQIYLPSCNDDFDGDGILNHLDLDADNDACPDFIEGEGLFSASDGTLAGGTLGDGNGGVVQNNLGNTVGLTAFVDNGIPTIATTGINLLISQNPLITRCVDSDADGILDFDDLDDDNDGILDIEESPSCFFDKSIYETGDRRGLIEVETDWNWNNGSLQNILNGNLTDNAVRQTTDFTFANETFLQFDFKNSIELEAITIITEGLLFLDFELIGVVQATNDTAAGWTDLTIPGNAILLDEVGPLTVNITQNANDYRFYRLFATNGRIDAWEWLREVEFSVRGATNGFTQKRICNSDFDNDGILNHLDLDSDNDGCADFIEADNYLTSTNGTAASGTLSDGNGGAVLNNLGNTIGTVQNVDLGIPTIAGTGNNLLISQNASLNGCLDSDGDGIADFDDLDDDNDGITDIEESPNCFFDKSSLEAGERTSLINVTTDWTWNRGSISNILDGSTTDNGVRRVSSDFTFTGQTFLMFEFLNPVEIESYTIYTEGAIFLDIELLGVVQGSNDKLTWIDLTVPNSAVLQDVVGPNTISLTQNLGNYRFYRIVANSGRIDAGEWMREIEFEINGASNTYTPLAVCNDDFDNDGILNHLDLDADNDACADFLEADDYLTLADESTASGTLSDGNSGIVSTNLGNTIGSNPNVDLGIPSIAATGNKLHISQNVFENGCADVDADGIANVHDLDDDNDGITDIEESPNCFYDKAIFESGNRTTIISVSTDWTWNQLSLSNILDGNTGNNSVRKTNGDFTFTGQTFLQFDFRRPVEIASFTIYTEGNAFLDIALRGVIQGSNDTLNWTDLSLQNGVILPDDPGPTTINVTQNSGHFQFYRLFANSGRIDDDEYLREVEFELLGSSTGLTYSPNCMDDFDGDGIFNHRDLDSDNDACADFLESYSAYILSDGVNVSSTLSDGNGGIVTENLGNTIGSTLNSNIGIPTNASNGNTDFISQDATRNGCDDFDSDGILDNFDLDDDNDGILDVDESPDCFFDKSIYETGNRISLINLSTDWTFQNGNFQNILDGTNGNAVRKTNGDFTFANQTFLQFEFDRPVEISAYTIVTEGGIFLDEALRGVFQGTNDTALGWTDLTISGEVILPDAGNTNTVNVTQNSAYYTFYRLFAFSGRIDDDEYLREVNFTLEGMENGNTPFEPCTADYDNDGILNHRDLDSDNDLCPDALESDVTLYFSDVDANYVLLGTQDANGIPTVTPGGQTVNASQDSTLLTCPGTCAPDGILTISCPSGIDYLSCNSVLDSTPNDAQEFINTGGSFTENYVPIVYPTVYESYDSIDASCSNNNVKIYRIHQMINGCNDTARCVQEFSYTRTSPSIVTKILKCE